ncbi:hypothetical protein GIB67_014351 [Kingdonia uniflora]|uniref:Endoglucanase n=1 Tax=Kingdonia uniflora TaxID=39325 RepID=A0A7J7NTB7_9MAGN|nr:hypothetical protein GIB67_014351 [Kingdonia uniflora]
MSSTKFLSLCFTMLVLLHNCVSAVLDYNAALTKSLLYFEGQRSEILPANQRVKWRDNSGLNDGHDAGIDLVGGYYDAGDNVKFGFPMAFTTTMLAWSVVEFGPWLSRKNELSHALDAIKWGTDYLMKAHTQPNVLYGEVGDGDSDHACWMRPEDMSTPRTTFKINVNHPGSDLAGETSAALAAASIAFKNSNPAYASRLLTHSKQLFNFAYNHQGTYQSSIPVAGGFYPSSGFQDELLWAAAWLYTATGNQTYLADHILSANDGGTRSLFSWDDKYVGAQVLIAKQFINNGSRMGQYKNHAEEFICNCVQKGNNNVKRSPGGLLYWQPWNDLQYTTTAVFASLAYSNSLAEANEVVQCAGGTVTPNDLVTFARSQVDYILGSNSKGMSYMVGLGSNYPKQIHHRGASIPSIKTDHVPVECKQGYAQWYNKNQANPNVLHGAIVGGPDENDQYSDSRSNYIQNEPATVITAPFVGVLARLA